MSYETIREQLRALTQGIPHKTANLANASALLSMTLPDLNWVGFYLLEGETLVLGPFQGKPACIEIPMGRGSAARRRRRTGFCWCQTSINFPDTLPVTASPAPSW